jgi:hypothetical protein
MDDSAAVTNLAADSATESVRKATAVLRSIAGKLRNPVPARIASLDGGWLLPLLAPLQQQLPMLEFNPLQAQSRSALSGLATNAALAGAKPVITEARAASQADMVDALLAAARRMQKKDAQKNTDQKLGAENMGTVVASAMATLAVKNHDNGNTKSRKFALVKPGTQSSLQDVGKLIADLMLQPVGSQAAPATSAQQTQNASAQKKATTVAPRVANGSARTGASTLAQLLQQLETLTADAVTSLVTGDGMLQTLAKDHSGAPAKAKKASTVSPQQSLALQQLSKLVADVLQQANQFAGRPATGSSAKTSLPAERSDEQANASSRADVGVGKATVQSSATVPTVVGNGANDAARPPDMYALADGISDVLREQAWLAGVDVL